MKVWLILLSVGLMLACSNKAQPGVLAQKKMMDVMWDLMQVDEFATSFVSRDTTLVLKTERIKLYKDVFRIHSISEQTFSSSYRYYSAHPDLMKMIFDSLSAKGERERKKLYLPKDSLQK